MPTSQLRKNIFALIIAGLSIFAVSMQYILMLQNITENIMESSIRFFSYFTILTNSMVAWFFISTLINKNLNSSKLTAVTVYITIVGLVYQLVLRQLWKPSGMQYLVDECLHSIVPLLVIIFWSLYSKNMLTPYRRITKWLLYPFLYFLFILARGSISGFYPYPFIDVSTIGYEKTMLNALLVLLLFIAIAVIFLFIGKKLIKR